MLLMIKNVFRLTELLYLYKYGRTNTDNSADTVVPRTKEIHPRVNFDLKVCTAFCCYFSVE